MLHTSHNMRNQDNILLHAVAALRARLPPKWQASPQPRSPSTPAAVVKITAPDRRTGTSNRTTGPVELSLDGPMLLIVPRAHLPNLARAL